jgi:hypothetical protein
MWNQTVISKERFPVNVNARDRHYDRLLSLQFAASVCDLHPYVLACAIVTIIINISITSIIVIVTLSGDFYVHLRMPFSINPLVKEMMHVKNKLLIDTGCVHGNMLSSVVIQSGKPFIKQQKALGDPVLAEPLPVLFPKQAEQVSVVDLDIHDRRRLDYILENKIQYIPGTISPADKDTDEGELESLRQGLRYYRQNGVQQVVLQPKYMGSRCMLYLSRDVSACYAVTRNGHKVHNPDLTAVYEQQLHRHKALMDEHDLQMLILDGELLPWRALGSGLIDSQFKTIEKALQTELHYLSTNRFGEHLAGLLRQLEESDFEQDQQTMAKQQLRKKYGDAVYQNYKAVLKLKNVTVPVKQHLEAYQTYKEQLALYGEEGELEYKPFAILKMIRRDGTEFVIHHDTEGTPTGVVKDTPQHGKNTPQHRKNTPNHAMTQPKVAQHTVKPLPISTTSAMFSTISDDEWLLLDFNDDDYLQRAYDYFQSLTTERKMEGVVIKPERMQTNVAPALKVRNAEYLALIYGYDYRFPHKYKKLLHQKNIRKKLRMSKAEYDLGQQMLAFAYQDIRTDNEDYQQVVANMLFEVGKEKEIDPRL